MAPMFCNAFINRWWVSLVGDSWKDNLSGYCCWAPFKETLMKHPPATFFEDQLCRNSGRRIASTFRNECIFVHFLLWHQPDRARDLWLAPTCPVRVSDLVHVRVPWARLVRPMWEPGRRIRPQHNAFEVAQSTQISHCFVHMILYRCVCYIYCPAECLWCDSNHRCLYMFGVHDMRQACCGHRRHWRKLVYPNAKKGLTALYDRSTLHHTLLRPTCQIVVQAKTANLNTFGTRVSWVTPVLVNQWIMFVSIFTIFCVRFSLRNTSVWQKGCRIVRSIMAHKIADCFHSSVGFKALSLSLALICQRNCRLRPQMVCISRSNQFAVAFFCMGILEDTLLFFVFENFLVQPWFCTFTVPFVLYDSIVNKVWDRVSG